MEKDEWIQRRMVVADGALSSPTALLVMQNQPQPVGVLFAQLQAIAQQPLEECTHEWKTAVRGHAWRTAMWEYFCDEKRRIGPGLQATEQPNADGSAAQIERLDNMLKAEGIMAEENVPIGDPTNPDHDDYREQMRACRDLYLSEQRDCEVHSANFSGHVMALVRDQASFRPISEQQIERMLSSVRQKLVGVQIQLKQMVCERVMQLKSRFLDARRKRRNFSRQATDVLNTYFHENITNPYPSEDVKEQLARRCGITVGQVSNWFGNKRIRYKKNIVRAQEDMRKFEEQSVQQQQQQTAATAAAAVAAAATMPYSLSAMYAAADPMQLQAAAAAAALAWGAPPPPSTSQHFDMSSGFAVPLPPPPPPNQDEDEDGAPPEKKRT